MNLFLETKLEKKISNRIHILILGPHL